MMKNRKTTWVCAISLVKAVKVIKHIVMNSLTQTFDVSRSRRCSYDGKVDCRIHVLFNLILFDTLRF